MRARLASLAMAFALILLGSCGDSGGSTRTNGSSAYGASMADIHRVPGGEMDDEHVEGWQRLTDEPELRAVEAYRSEDDEWPWMVSVSVAEFLREEPLEAELRDGMATALRAVPGVTNVLQEDREVWLVAGEGPSGRDLVAAAASVVDSLAPRARPAVEGY